MRWLDNLDYWASKSRAEMPTIFAALIVCMLGVGCLVSAIAGARFEARCVARGGVSIEHQYCVKPGAIIK